MPIFGIKQSNEKVFEKTFEHWHARLYTYFHHKTHSDYIAEELVQLTFIKLWNFRHTLKEDLPFEAQLFTIARSTMLDFLRQKANQQRHLEKAGNELPTSTEPVWNFDRRYAAHPLVEALPPIRRQVFLLNRYEGYSNHEIAAKLDISVRTVEKHISLALKQLRSKFSIIIFLAHYVFSHF